MAGRSCLRTASAQASSRALIRISSVLTCSDMASAPLSVRGRAKEHEPDTGARRKLACLGRPTQRQCKRRPFGSPRLLSDYRQDGGCALSVLLWRRRQPSKASHPRLARPPLTPRSRGGCRGLFGTRRLGAFGTSCSRPTLLPKTH